MLAIVCILALPIIIIYAIVTRGGEKSTPAPKEKDPIDKYMDDNYADIDWLRKGKL